MPKTNLDNFDDSEVLEALRKLGVPEEDLGITEQTEEVPADVSDDGEEVAEQTEQADDSLEEPEEPTVNKKQSSKEERKILALKKQLREQAQKLREYEDAQAKLKADEHRSELKKSFIERGYEEAEADRFADTELTVRTLKERIELQDFREDYADVLSKYPQSRQEVKWLLETSKTSGLSVEQLCLAKYGQASDEPAYERRAKDAMSGKLDDSGIEDRVSTATKTATRPTGQALTSKDIQQKRVLEQMTGQPMDNKEYLAYKKKFNL